VGVSAVAEYVCRQLKTVTVCVKVPPLAHFLPNNNNNNNNNNGNSLSDDIRRVLGDMSVVSSDSQTVTTIDAQTLLCNILSLKTNDTLTTTITTDADAELDEVMLLKLKIFRSVISSCSVPNKSTTTAEAGMGTA